MPNYIIRTMAPDGHLCLLMGPSSFPNNIAAIDTARKFVRGNQTAEVLRDEQCIYRDEPSGEKKVLRFQSKDIFTVTK